MDLILTILSDILTSLRLTRLLEVVSIIICLCLISSPGIVATILAMGTKLGVITYVREAKQSEAKDA